MELVKIGPCVVARTNNHTAGVTRIRKPSADVRPPPVKAPAEHAKIAVAVSVFPDYLQYLPAAIKSIEDQHHAFDEKWLLLDQCGIMAKSLPAGWKTYEFFAHAPGPGRTWAVGHTQCGWICFLDADDIFHGRAAAEYSRAAAMARLPIGVIYPDLYYTDGALGSPALRPVSDWDARVLKSHNFVPTPSLWRVSMLRELGGWPKLVPVMDDWCTIVQAAGRGYTGQHLRVPLVYVRKHGNNRSAQIARRLDTCWEARRLAIVTLLAGREACLGDWVRWLRKADLPTKTCVYAVFDPRCTRDFRTKVANRLARLPHSFSIVRATLPGRSAHRSERVAWLYNQVLPQACAGSELVLMVEDDVVPPLDGFRKLHEVLLPNAYERIGAVAGVYATRGGGGKQVSLSTDPNIWRGSLTFDDIRPGAQPICMVPGGFTLHHSNALAEVLPLHFGRQGRELLGWDANRSRAMVDNGWGLKYHGDVICAHNFQAWDEGNTD